VAGQSFLRVLELLPPHVRLVVVAQQHRPRLARTRTTVGLAHGTVDYSGLDRRLPVGIRARVERILQHAEDVAVHRRSPGNLVQLLAIGWARKQDAFLAHVPEDLPRAAQTLEELEHRPDGILDPTIRAQCESGVTRPDVSNGYRKTQLTTAGLGHRGLEQSCAQRGELELAHRPLQAE